MQLFDLATIDKQQLRRDIRRGQLFTRVNPDQLEDQELLPALPWENCLAPALSLRPFPLLPGLSPLESKIRHCYGSKPPRPFILARAENQLQRWYNLAEPREARDFPWLDLAYAKCPYPPLVRDTLGIISRYAIPPELEGSGSNLQLALARDELLLDCWETPVSDDLGWVFILVAKENQAEEVLLTSILTNTPRGAQESGTYKISLERYQFLLGLFFQLLGERFAPKALNVSTGRYRGRIYTKPD